MSNLSSIPWPDVVAVGIRTTADGPFAEDLYWQFLLRDGFLELPGERVDTAAFDELRDHLPGIDWAKVIRATTSIVERIFCVWHHEESRFAPTVDELAVRYCDLVGRLGGKATKAAFDRVHSAWAAERRRYHGVEHLVDCLRELDRTDVASPTRELVELALWYHDIVYEPGRRDNEQRSAQALLVDASELGIATDAASAAAELVCFTAHASTAPRTAAADLVLDIDLSILARDVLRFMDYEYGVAEEYAAMSTIAFRVERGRFLASLLARRQLFRTQLFRERYEQRARTQIAALLATPRYRCYRWARWLTGPFRARRAATP